VEKGHLIGVLRLFRHGFVPAAEGAVRIFRQAAVMVYLQRRIQQLAHRFERCRGIHQRGKGVETLPIRSVWLRMASRSVGFACCSAPGRAG
jgi:hypothetical protein